MALTDREKIIKGLECCMSETQCHKCPYRGECDDKGYYYSKAIDDAIALLKSEPSEPQRRYLRCDNKYSDLYTCSICGYMDLHYKQQYCGGCGRKVNWNE